MIDVPPGADESWRQRIAFIDLNEQDSEALRAFWPVLEPKLSGMLHRFYATLEKYPQTAALLNESGKVARLKGAQTEHWKSLFAGRFDDAYFQRVLRIGKAHERVGLEPRWYLGGYVLMLSEIHAVAVEHYKRKPSELAKVIVAIDKAVMLDAELSVSIYLDEAKSSFQKRLGEIADDVTTSIETVANAVVDEAETVHSLAETVQHGADQTRDRSSSVANSAAQSSEDIQTTAAAAEEMSASVAEISSQITVAADLARKAVSATEDSNTKVSGLADAAQRIGEVVNLIQDIARQTNLLALNASIEAARAGEAGRGFAVVANEVKALARQTADATADISSQVDAIRGSVAGTVDSLKTIGDVIAEIDTSSAAIAATVQQQHGAAGDVARTMSRIAQSAQDVSGAIADLSTVAGDSASASSQLNTSANDLVAHGRTLKDSVGSLAERLRNAG